jgi:hypothetical protein
MSARKVEAKANGVQPGVDAGDVGSGGVLAVVFREVSVFLFGIPMLAVVFREVSV